MYIIDLLFLQSFPLCNIHLHVLFIINISPFAANLPDVKPTFLVVGCSSRWGPYPPLPPATCLSHSYQGKSGSRATALRSWLVNTKGQQQLTPPSACPLPPLQG